MNSFDKDSMAFCDLNKKTVDCFSIVFTNNRESPVSMTFFALCTPSFVLVANKALYHSLRLIRENGTDAPLIKNNI